MSRDKPWHAHKFRKQKLSAQSCSICGQPEAARHHQQRRKPFRWKKILANKEEIYGKPVNLRA